MTREKNIIGLRIKKIRKEKGLTIIQLANILGVKPAYLTSVELGVINISLKCLLSFCKELDVDPDYLVLGDFYYKIKPFIENLNEQELTTIKELLKNV